MLIIYSGVATFSAPEASTRTAAHNRNYKNHNSLPNALLFGSVI